MVKLETAGPTRVEFFASRAGAYRVNILGDDPSKTVNLLVTGTRSNEVVLLEAGHHNVRIEDLSRGEQNSFEMDLRGEPYRSVVIDEYEASAIRPKSSKPSRPSRARLLANTPREQETSSGDKADNPGVMPTQLRRHMTLGLSVDTRPDGRGGWRPGTLEAHVPVDRSDKSLAFIFLQPADWQAKPKWRLSVAVENDVACHVPLPLFRDGVRVEIVAVDTPTGPDVAVTMLPCALHSAALVSALKRNWSDSTELVEWSSGSNVGGAIGILAEKMEDPWAAAAASLLLVRSGEIGPVAHWAANLADRFPWLADAGVVAAWAHAATGSGEEAEIENSCLRRLTWARRRGALYFSAANALAIEMLTTLVSGGVGPNIRSRAQKELASWSRWTRRLVKGSTFVNWEETGTRLSSGILPPAHYAILAQGTVSAQGLEAIPPDNIAGALAGPEGLALAYEAPEVLQVDQPSTFTLALGSKQDGWALREAGTGRMLDVFPSKAEAIAGGKLRKALGSRGGLVEIYSHDGHFQEERTFRDDDHDVGSSSEG